MTGISYKAIVEDRDMRAKLGELIDRMENRQGFYKNVGEHLMNALGDRFDNEEAPDGTKWVGLSAVTIARREAAGHQPGPILRASGAFRGSFNSIATNDDVRIGTPAVQAAMMHFGGESKGYMKATIQARPILGMSPADEEEIFAMAEEWLGSK
jgi:phage virion morphogenesis protein